jgi:hypothetical protein
MNMVRFTLPLAVAHALLTEAVYARAFEAGFVDPQLEFENGDWSDETIIACSIPMARFILTELARIKTNHEDDTELWFLLTEATFIVQRSVDAHAVS